MTDLNDQVPAAVLAAMGWTDKGEDHWEDPDGALWYRPGTDPLQFVGAMLEWLRSRCSVLVTPEEIILLAFNADGPKRRSYSTFADAVLAVAEKSNERSSA